MSRPKKSNLVERAALPATTASEEARAPAPRPSKLATIVALLHVPDGATIDALCQATGWQSHSVRGALAGSLKRKGYDVTSTKPGDGPRRYRIEA